MENNSPSQILLISSRSDIAGSLIHTEVFRLLQENPSLANRYQHKQVDDRLIYLDGPSLLTNADLIIFLSRHASVEDRAVLTVHVTGNFGDAEFGGANKTLTPAATEMMHSLLNRLSENVPEGYDITYEATHHGPTGIPVPSCFIEAGSTEKEWRDAKAAAAIARAVIGADYSDIIRLAGFGGTHYAKRQTEITLTTRGGFGHIMPSRSLIHLDRRMFLCIIEKTQAHAVYIDRKSVSKDDISKIEEFSQQENIPVIGQTDLINMRDMSFSQYRDIISLADSILPGSSVDTHAMVDAVDLVPVKIPADLISTAAKEDPTGLKDGLDLLKVARLSGGGIAFYPVFIACREEMSQISDDLIHLCVSIIKRKCDYRIDGDCLIIKKQKFDPIKAQKLGVSPGPDFSRLMKGQEVQVHNFTITPAMVMNTTEKRICIPDWGK